MKTIQYLQTFGYFRQNDEEISVDGRDVHAAAYQRINYGIHIIFIQGIYSDMLLNYSKNMSLSKNYKILHLLLTRSGEVGSLEMG